MATRRPRLTEAERETIYQLRESGWSARRIAEKIGCSKGSVNWCCLMAGVTKHDRPKKAAAPRVPLVRRDGHVIRPFQPDDDRRLIELEQQGLNYTEIARALGRRRNSIVGRLATLASYGDAA